MAHRSLPCLEPGRTNIVRHWTSSVRWWIKWQMVRHQESQSWYDIMPLLCDQAWFQPETLLLHPHCISVGVCNTQTRGKKNNSRVASPLPNYYYYCHHHHCCCLRYFFSRSSLPILDAAPHSTYEVDHLLHPPQVPDPFLWTFSVHSLLKIKSWHPR